MCQKCLLCHGDLLSELHFTECSQIFISLKAPQRYEQACIHICHHCPFFQRQEISLKLRGGKEKKERGRETASGDQGTSPSKPCKQWYLSNTEMAFWNMADDFSVFIPPPLLSLIAAKYILTEHT